MSRKYLRSVIHKESNKSRSIRITNESPPISIINESPGTNITPQTCNSMLSVPLPLDICIASKSVLPLTVCNGNTFMSSPFTMSSSVHVETILSTDTNVTNLNQDLKRWAIENKVPHNVFNNLLTILKNVNGVEELKNLPSDCRTILKVDKTSNIVSTSSGNYYHFGLSEGICYILRNDRTLIDQVICFDLNIDGLPLTKSSGSQFWPLLGSICSSKKPFLIGVWHGYKKPKHPNEILGPFIAEYLALKVSGILYDNQKIDISLSKIICDAPAKSFVLCIKGHNSYFGCTKCITEGTYLNNRVCYGVLNAALRTDSHFRTGLYGEDYHVNTTPLLQLEIDLIRNIPLDYMHLVCLGVMKRLISFWCKGNISIRMMANDLDDVNETILDMRNHLSYKDFARLPRPLSDSDRWKATEFRQFLLYLGPIVLKSKLKPTQYMHFLSLSCAIRILCSTELSVMHNDYAKELLMYFVKNYSKLYGEQYISHNVHNLIHLADDVLNLGPLDSFSAFQYENYMSEIKKSLKTCNKPLQQIINREHEKRSVQKCNETSYSNKTVFGYVTSYKEPLLNDSLVKTYKSISFLHFKLGTDIKNNHCVLKDNTVIKIVKLIQCENTKSIYIIFRRYLCYESCFTQPCQSSLFYGGTVTNLCSTNEIVNMEQVLTKCINYKNYVIHFIL